MTPSTRFSVGFPESCVEIPGSGTWNPELDPNVMALVATRTQRFEALMTALKVVHSTAFGVSRPHRMAWAVVHNWAAGRVDGLLTVDVRELLSGESVDSYADQLHPGVIEVRDEPTVNFESEIIELSNGTAVVSHDIQFAKVSEGRQPSPALERAFVALFPPGQFMFEYRLIAQDFRAFSDMRAYLIGVASSLTQESVSSA